MIEAIKIWNEPNNLSHWDFEMDPQWVEFSEMASLAIQTIRQKRPALPVILGGVSPIDTGFLKILEGHGLLEQVDAVAVHGFPLDWNHWKIEEWPRKIEEVRAITDLPIWVTEVGVSSFGAEEVQVFGLNRTLQLLNKKVDRIFWYSLLDLPPAWGATTRHKESEGSSYYRHFYMGLVRADGSPKLALHHFNPNLIEPSVGICQWFHFKDPRLETAVQWLELLGVKKLRTGISWADWLRPGAVEWYDRQMGALQNFETTVTLCFTPPSRGKRACVTSPPINPKEFAEFAGQVVERYVPAKVLPLQHIEKGCEAYV